MQQLLKATAAQAAPTSIWLAILQYILLADNTTANADELLTQPKGNSPQLITWALAHSLEISAVELLLMDYYSPLPSCLSSLHEPTVLPTQDRLFCLLHKTSQALEVMDSKTAEPNPHMLCGFFHLIAFLLQPKCERLRPELSLHLQPGIMI